MTIASTANKKIKKSRSLGFDFDFKIRDKKTIRSASRRNSRLSVYASQLRMKQIVKFYYSIPEKQLKKYYAEASRRSEPTGITLIHLLESRLDNCIYRMGFAATRAQARQMVGHGHVLVNGKRVNIRSYIVNIGDVISISEKARKHDRVNSAIEIMKENENQADWFQIDYDKYEGELKAFPELSALPDEFSKISLVVEWYSK